MHKSLVLRFSLFPNLNQRCLTLVATFLTHLENKKNQYFHHIFPSKKQSHNLKIKLAKKSSTGNGKVHPRTGHEGPEGE
jgi:hypothetical protein